MGCGFENIPNEKLTIKCIPTPNMSWWEISEFALTFDGYGYWDGTGAFGKFANEAQENWKQSGKLPASLSELRSCLFFEQRRFHHFGMPPDGEDLDYSKALLRAIREKVEQGALD